MDTLKLGWDFFQNEVLGMKWLNRLIGDLLYSPGGRQVDRKSKYRRRSPALYCFF